MNTRLKHRLIGAVMFWTVLTTVFTWLPLVRIMGRPAEYHWQVLGLSGEGLNGPFWVFIPFALFAVVLLWMAERGPRRFFYPMLIGWHLFVCGIVIASLVQGGVDADWQGQGLHWQIPMSIAMIPVFLFTALSLLWVVIDNSDPARQVSAWSRANSIRLGVSLSLLLLGLGFFRAGDNYNWVTSVAIILTISHWITLAWAFESIRTSNSESQRQDSEIRLPKHTWVDQA